MQSIKIISEQLLNKQSLLDDTVYLRLDYSDIEIHSNSQRLLDNLRQYFKHCKALGKKELAEKELAKKAAIKNTQPIQIIAIESEAPELALDFKDWKREPGKTGRKDEYADISDARVVRKVRTGMVFLQSEQQRIAAGPCIANDNQVINFINSQYMNFLQNKGWLICHASGLIFKDKGVAIAGLSGGGKSTLMLQLLDNKEVAYVTNDRLFIKQQQANVGMLGIAKLPRINPGTIVGNPLLHNLLTSEQLSYYQAMPTEQLWHIEEKSDVPVAEIFGQNSIQFGGNLDTFIVLNWDRESNEALSLTQVDISQRDDLLPAIMKSPGPFYQYLDGHFESDREDFDRQRYIKALAGIRIFEVKGKIDFTKMTQLCLEVIALDEK